MSETTSDTSPVGVSPTSPTSPTSTTAAAQKSTASRVAAASLVGTIIEYYDFAVYGTAAALVLGPAFFPSGNATLSTLAAFLTVAAAFLARPLGVLVFGGIGDRVGRKRALFLSLLLMGVSTVGVGLLPTYETAGFVAPVLLVVLRLLQGVSMGGEWGGAVLLAAEHAPPGRRALYASIPQAGPPLGFLLSSAVILPTLAIAGKDGFAEWAWRIPFLLSTVLIVVGLWVRSRIAESPVFEERSTGAAAPPRFPLGALVKEYPGRLLLGMGAAIGGSSVYYLATVYSLSYGPTALGIPQPTMLTATSIAAAADVAVTVPLAIMADRVGRRPVMLTGAAGCALWALPMFGSLQTGNGVLIAGAFTIGLVLFSMMFVPMAAFLPELFPARLRYTGASATFILAVTLGGGFAPLVATWLTSHWQSPLVLGLYAGVLCLVSLGCVLALPETRDKDFSV
ncbi:MFS transporter [Streptomyces sp. NPDC054940]